MNAIIDEHRTIAISKAGRLKSPAASRRNRAGFTMVELIGTCLLLGAMFSLTVPMLFVIARERRTAEQRQFAIQDATNLLEMTSVQPWSEMTTGELKLPDPDEELKTILPGLERKVTATESTSEPDTRRLTATVRWRNHAGQYVEPIRMTAWACAPKEVP